MWRCIKQNQTTNPGGILELKKFVELLECLGLRSG